MASTMGFLRVIWVYHGFFAGFCGLCGSSMGSLQAFAGFAGFAEFFAGLSRVCRVFITGSNHICRFLDTSS
jgi:hypothetical protein